MNPNNQGAFTIDDGSGLRVISAEFKAEEKFDWDLFRGYDSIRVLTYSASIPAIVKMLSDFDFARFDCVFGCESILRDIRDIIAFQKVAVGDARAAIMGLRDDRHAFILSRVREGQASFRVVREYVSHAKLYLLSSSTNAENGSPAPERTRVIVGSANLSERAFSGKQPETLVKFDNDEAAWNYYYGMYRRIRNSADEIELPPERITQAAIDIHKTPVLEDATGTLIIDNSDADEDMRFVVHTQLESIQKVRAVVSDQIASAVPAFRSEKQQITPKVKREISSVQFVKSSEEPEHLYFSLDTANSTANLSGERFSLDWDQSLVERDAQLMLDYFHNYAEAFEGDVMRLQKDYFTLWAWLYFAPFMCDMRTLALFRDEDIIRYPMFAIVFGKSNCGKTSLIDTLLTSMFNKAHMVDKRSFTTAQMRGLQHAYKRFPVVFDDIGRTPFRNHGRDMIKNESKPTVAEYPCFVLSMNADPNAYPDEIVKRSLMIHTTTALPPHNEALRQQMHVKIQRVRNGLSGHLYRCYLTNVMERLHDRSLPEDWLLLSSKTLTDILDESVAMKTTPEWCRPITWLEYADNRYDRVKSRLNELLRPNAMMRSESDAPIGWLLDGDRVIVKEQVNTFGRSSFDWEDVPSTLLNEDTSSTGRTVLHKNNLEDFLGRSLQPRPVWRFWQRNR